MTDQKAFKVWFDKMSDVYLILADGERGEAAPLQDRLPPMTMPVSSNPSCYTALPHPRTWLVSAQ